MESAVRVALYLAVIVHVVACPFAKVEESFNLQAMHDLLFHGTNITAYDHNEFPGVVPRTFIGAIAVSTLASPVWWVLGMIGATRLFHQYLVRFVLGLLTVGALDFFCQSVAKVFGPATAKWIAIVTLCQFHFLFYASRTLPNTFALILVTIALGHWLLKKIEHVIVLLAIAAVIFRGEVVVLAGPLLLLSLINGEISLGRGIAMGVAAGVASLALTIFVDSYFWQRWLWPEGEVLFFNTVLNRSADWGVQPFWWYFGSALPRALLAALPFAILGMILERRLWTYMAPPAIFVLLYSFLPHKELRFIIYVVPLFNLAAASFLARCENNARKVGWGIVYRIALILLCGSFCTTLLFSYTSFHNYPGGHLLKRLHERVPASSAVNVHIDVPTAMTGASRFGEQHWGTWTYSKAEDLEPSEFDQFTHIITALPDNFRQFESIDVEYAFDRVTWGATGSRWLLHRVEKSLGIDLPGPLSRLLSVLSIDVKLKPALFLMKKRQ